eukprot:5271324-Amphidinium_carterae.1
MQVLSFVDPETGSDIVIVGCMHFNPHSIEKSREITRHAHGLKTSSGKSVCVLANAAPVALGDRRACVRKLAEEGKLAAVVLETCQDWVP